MDGNFFEDFALGQHIRHATPRTVTAGGVALYTALYGSRFAGESSTALAAAIGYGGAPLDGLFVFPIVFCQTLPGRSLHPVAEPRSSPWPVLAPGHSRGTLSAPP